MRLNFIASLALLLALTPFAHSALPLPSETEFQLNRGSDAMTRNALGTQVTTKAVHDMRALYDFSTMGGLVSTIKLQDIFDKKAAQLPGKAIIKNCYIDVLTAPTSGGSATIAIGTGQTNVDLKAATAISSFTVGSIIACIPVGSAATAIKLTNAKTTAVVPTLTIATAALTAGKLLIHIEYILSE